MKNIYIMKHFCSKCNAVFNAPSLSDFSYGEFLLWSTSGDCRYLNVFEDQTYNEVIKLISDCENNNSNDNFLQDIYGELACDPDENGLFFCISNPPCPKCGSIHMASIGDQKMGEVSVKTVTHVFWSSLSYEEKKNRLRSIGG